MKLSQVRLELLRHTPDVLLSFLTCLLPLKGLVCLLLIPGISDLGSARIQARTTYAEEGEFLHQNTRIDALLTYLKDTSLLSMWMSGLSQPVVVVVVAAA